VWHACDLHIHTSFSSDADVAPEDVAAAAKQRGVSLVAITDHHDVRGWRPARAAARGTGVAVIPGVELTCPDGASAVHVLGIFGLKGFDEDAVIEALGLHKAGLGSAEGAVDYGVAEATRRIHALGGLAIAAHAKGPKGLLKECSSHALARVMAEAEFDAIEIPAAGDPWRKIGLPASVADLPVVSGSDAHHVEDRPGDPTARTGSARARAGSTPANAHLGSRRCASR
jgi:PHP family Zn ribbon phosphoesterase